MPNPIYTNPTRHPEDTGVHIIGREINLGVVGLATGQLPIGALGTNAVPLRAGVTILTAFNAETTNVLEFGTTGDPDYLITSANAAAGTLGKKNGTGVGIGQPLAADTVFYAKFTQTGAAATTGKALVWVEAFISRTENPALAAGV